MVDQSTPMQRLRFHTQPPLRNFWTRNRSDCWLSFLGKLPPLNVSFQCAASWLRLGDGVAHG
ncbi:hypothetical protein [Aeromonas rivipollensis]|uniref:hypothetical protein n=1 Tax=Aeromonas rivipollensis TaxID=948519 RepID=UPI00398C3C37